MAATPASPPKIGSLTFPTMAANTDTGITAYAGGGQTNATLLTAQFNKVTVVVTAADSVKLPQISAVPNTLGAVGSSVIVRNADSADSLQVFGSGTDTINDVATGTGVAVAAGKTAIFICHSWNGTVGNWYMVLSA
jgi:hypothetical protein